MTRRNRMRAAAAAGLLVVCVAGSANATSAIGGPGPNTLKGAPGGDRLEGRGVAATMPAERAAGVTTRVSISNDGAQAHGPSRVPAISADGRYVAFTSDAPNLVPEDTDYNYVHEVFVRDRKNRTTQLVSVTPNDLPAHRSSGSPTISSDGRFVAFWSKARLTPGDTNSFSDVYVRDLQTGTTELVSIKDGDAQVAKGGSEPKISGDGRFVSFLSARKLDPNGTYVPGGFSEFVRDRAAGTTQWVMNNEEVEAISEDARFVAFPSFNRLTPNDTDDVYDVYVLDRRTGTTRLASTRGVNALEVSLSGNGRFVAYSALPTPGAEDRQVFVRDMWSKTTEIASVNSRGVPGDDESFDPVLSRDGHYIAFGSQSHNLSPRTSRWPLVYGHDLRTGVTRLISVSSSGEIANRATIDEGEAPIAVSGTGRFIAFESDATNLVRHDTNERLDVFVRDRRLR